MAISKISANQELPPAPEERFKDWITKFPDQFPDVFEPEKMHLNPFIQDQQEYTYQNVRNGLKFLEEVALPWSNVDTFSLGDEATWGYIRFLQCLSGAMEFEDKHRKDGGFETVDIEE